jgi:uncharacterized protein (UPF0212 family)
MSGYIDWLKVYGTTDVSACPACGERTLDLVFVFAGDPVTRMGWGVLWCRSCRHAARLSRARAPQHVRIASGEEFTRMMNRELRDLRFVEDDP